MELLTFGFAFSELYRKTNYLSPMPVVINRITEYDIRRANTSILRRYRKVRSETLDRIEGLPSHDRKVIIGKMMRKDPAIKGIIADGIRRAKFELFFSNRIQDAEILSIKNDAVFIIGRKLRRTEFKGVEFRPKNVYSAYLNLEGVEFYYEGRTGTVTAKGVSDAVLEHPDHRNGMLRFLSTVMGHLAYDRRDALRRYLISFAVSYKEKTLPLEYYRELGSSNIYRTEIELSDYGYNVDTVGESEREIINGIYNYRRFILPLVQRYV